MNSYFIIIIESERQKNGSVRKTVTQEKQTFLRYDNENNNPKKRMLKDWLRESIRIHGDGTHDDGTLTESVFFNRIFTKLRVW